jgi:DNA polymerase-3 subunit delta
MIHVLYGTDEYTIQKTLRKIKEGLGDAESLTNNTVYLQGSKLTPDELRAHVQAMPFLALHRLVIVEGLLKKLDASASRSKKKADQPTPAGDFNNVMKNDVCPTTELLFVDPDYALKDRTSDLSKHPLFEGVPNIQFHACNLMGQQELSSWVRQYVMARGGKIAVDAVGTLVQFIGSDLWAMSGNIEKLLSYANGREITKKDVVLMVPELGNDQDIWNLLKSVMNRDINLSMKLYLRLTDNGADPFYILTMLISQLRKVIRCKNWMAEGYNGDRLTKVTGINAWAIRDAVNQASKYSHEELIGLYRRFLETDVDMKTGGMVPDTAVTTLIAEVCVGR